ncbi:hypothetical protein CALVIDRAFT_141334 [Calocera viscosa TUFC12733]|uniref:DNA replication regulator SLD2 n=1 Tax=Calocera viscosa (strain TUFC12733) TaxID=1330018 RepID=A0A167LPI9_CALVF|nr:hypothetical protein CALVIDRAFT_141334 [Calocera viscosa TUFC12733]
MDGDTATIDLNQLRAELKTWERDFKTKKGRDPTRDDIKKVPAIDTKYKLYNKSRSKPGRASGTASQEGTEKKAKAKERSSSRPSPTASSATAVESVGNVEETFNPFRSPRKGGPSSGKSPVKRRLSIFTDEDPFAAGDDHEAPTSSLFSKLKSSSPANNAFGSPKKKPLFMGASDYALPSTPSRSILKPSTTTLAISDAQPAVVLSPSKYVSASSPAKLRALIQSTKAADTPRTKARKRLAGEEDFTPVKSDKRRRLSSLAVAEGPSSEGVEKDEGAHTEEEMDVDEFGPTPKKADVPRRFKPIFESPLKQDQKTKGIFSKRTVSFNAASSSRESSSQPPEQLQATTSRKRPASPDPAVSKASASMRLIPPSPPAAAGGSKGKARKKPKKARKQSKDEEEADASSSERETEIKQIPFSRWGGLQATRRSPKGPDDENDEIWDFDVRRPAPALSQDSAFAEEAEEEMTVRLPTDMFDLLDLDSPVKSRREEEQLVKGIFDPRRKTSDRQVVFGAGEWEAAEGEGDDWEEEPDGWKGDAELDLDDF